MSLGRSEIRHLAELARLRLSAAEEELFGEQLGPVIDYVHEHLAAATMQDFPTPEPPAGREATDEIAPGLDRAAVLANAPRHDEGFFEVPAVKPVSQEAPRGGATE